MARKARVKSSTGMYVVLLRGIDDTIFKSKKRKDLFSELAKTHLGEGLCDIEFKNDSVGMLVKESEAGLGLDMKPLVISFARAYNRENGTSGKVFKDRFKSCPVEPIIDEEDYNGFFSSQNGKNIFKSKTPAEKRVSSDKPASKKVAKSEPIPEPEVKPAPKKRNDMPTWLL